MEIKEVFEPVLNFIKNLQKKEKEITSKQAAKERLKLVLMQDRTSVSPDFFEMMKQEIIDVIKKYIEIDEEAMEVGITKSVNVDLGNSTLKANIPIKNVKPIAPKVESDDEIDELLVDSLFDGPALSEEEAEKAANEIISQLEESVRADILNDQIVGGPVVQKNEEIKTDIPGAINDMPENEIADKENTVEVEEKVTKKKVTKATTTKKKTTAKSATKTSVKSKTTKTTAKTTAKKKKEE